MKKTLLLFLLPLLGKSQNDTIFKIDGKVIPYADKYYVEKKAIYLIGISFSKKEKNINGFKSEKLRSK
jgi:hypothetical protein